MPVKRVRPIPAETSIDWDVEGTHAASDGVVVHVVGDDELRWLASNRLRFQRVLERRGNALDLGRTGWTVREVTVDDVQRAVVLHAHHTDGRTLLLGLRPPEHLPDAMARSDRFALWVIAVDFHPTPDQDLAIKALIAMLDLKMPAHAERERPEPR